MWLDACVLACGALIAWKLSRPTSTRLRQRGEQFARQSRAYVDSEFVGPFDRLTRMSMYFQAAGIFLSFALLVVFRYVYPDALPMAYLAATLFVGLGWSVYRVWVAGREFPTRAGQAAIARPRRIVLADFVSPMAQALLAFDLVLVAGFVVIVVQTRPDEFGAHFAAVSLFIAIALAAVCAATYAAGHAMCQRPQAAGDACHLYLQDAWRADHLVGSFAAVEVCAVLFMALLGSAVHLPKWFTQMGPVPLFVLVAAHFAILGRERLRFRARLWPTLAPQQVLLPGDPIPPRRGVVA